MPRLVSVLALTMTTAGTAYASDQDAARGIAFKLGIAYHCAAAMGDERLYEDAKAGVPEDFRGAGVTGVTPDELIASIEAQEPGEGLTADDCTRLLEMFE